jgi:N-acetylmuramoyl-L-alanine amidase
MSKIKGFIGRWYIKVLMLLVPVCLLVFLAANVNTADKAAFIDNGGISNESVAVGEAGNNEVKSVVKIEEKKPEEISIVIDPGHGGEDWGTYYGDIYEKNVNLDVSLRLGKLLKNDGIKVVYTREKDDFVELRERSDIANELDAALFLSIHHNKMPDSPGYRGTETLYTFGNTSVGVMNGKRFAEVVQAELVKTLKTVDNGIIYSQTFLCCGILKCRLLSPKLGTFQIARTGLELERGIQAKSLRSSL